MENEFGIFKPLSVGDKVDNFVFKYYQDGKFHDGEMSQFEGKWMVLFFYPADFTFVCPTELEELADNYDKFKAEGVEIISVSTDTEFTHKAWHDSSPAISKVQFPMAADPTGKMSMALGTYIEDEGLSLRGTFIIDPKGIIKSAEINDNSIGRSATELLRKVQAAKFVEEHEGLVCPASWKPGDDTLEPGEDLVGKI